MEASGNLYWGGRDGSFPSLEENPTVADPLFFLDEENGIFFLEANSPAIDLGSGPLLEDQTHDWNAIPYTGRVDAGPALYNEEDTE
jgi:hypothetical protein